MVYDIEPGGATRYPPLHVAMPDGATRPLSEQERTYQARRAPRPLLPYHMTRIKRMEELE